MYNVHNFIGGFSDLTIDNCRYYPENPSRDCTLNRTQIYNAQIWNSFSVIMLCLGMFFLTFLFGYLPTKIKTSQRLMNLIAIFGAGLLVGAALEVIIPEGVITLMDSFKIERAAAHTQLISIADVDDLDNGNGRTFSLQSEVEHEPSIVKYIGGSLVVGFAIMMVID